MGEEDDPLYLSPDEAEKISKLTDQFSGPQALKMVLKGERYRRYVAAQARAAIERSSQEAAEQRREREEAQRQQSTEDLMKLMRSTYPKPGPEEDEALCEPESEDESA